MEGPVGVSKAEGPDPQAVVSVKPADLVRARVISDDPWEQLDWMIDQEASWGAIGGSAFEEPPEALACGLAGAWDATSSGGGVFSRRPVQGASRCLVPGGLRLAGLAGVSVGCLTARSLDLVCWLLREKRSQLGGHCFVSFCLIAPHFVTL